MTEVIRAIDTELCTSHDHNLDDGTMETGITTRYPFALQGEGEMVARGILLY